MVNKIVKHKQRKEKRHSLKRSLVLWFLSLALVPMLLVSWITYYQTHIILKQNAADKLEQVARAKTSFLQNWFDYRFMDLKSQSEDKQNAELLMELRKGLLKSGLSTKEYVKSFDWAKRVDIAQNNLISLLRNYDYIYDLFLIDTDGNILYSVIHESDLGSNLFTGSLSNTRFAKSVNNTLQTGEAIFSDIERYKPSNNDIAGFLTAPLLDEYGNKVGVFAIQLKLDRVMAQIVEFTGRDISHLHYLVGEDGYLRSEIGHKKDDVLVRTIQSIQLRLWQKEHLEKELERGKQKRESFNYIGASGEEVIGLHHNIHLPGVEWVLISEINQQAALAAGHWLEMEILILLIAMGLLVSILAYIKARQITRPIIDLADASMAVAAGEQEHLVTVSNNDELGQLAKSFNYLLQVRNSHEKSLLLSNSETQKALDALAEQRIATDEHSIVGVTDIKGNITFCNDKFCEISGYSREELMGQNHRLLNSEQHKKSFFTDMFKKISKGHAWHGEICNRAKNGDLYWVDSTIVPSKGSDGKITSYIAIRTDISKLKRVEQSLIEAKQTAELANKAKGEFLANMSHEIRTPMNGVLGMTNLLLDSSLDEQQRNRTRTLKRSAESLLVVINDILDFSKIEAGKLDIELIDFDLGTLIEDFASTMAYKAEEKKLELICPTNPINHRCYKGDPGRIRQVLTNLVGNALKFTERGEIAVGYEEQSTGDGQVQLRFSITDTGIGLGAKQQQGLFERFTQADGSTTRKYGGTGLGLSICKQLVELMGGEIGVSSRLGEGSNFWFTLPLELLPQATSLSKKSSKLEEQKILIVDDNATNRQLLSALLTYWKIEHLATNSGSLALQLLYDADEEGKPFTTALIDMKMPVMNGMQLGEIIRHDEKLAVIKMILFTCQNRRSSDARQISEAGFSDYLSKPINQTTLYNSLLRISGENSQSELHLKDRANNTVQQFNARILVVEDNITNQEVAIGMLEKFGLSIDVVGNGKEALASLEQFPYDLVFMDCQMPVMDGYQATQKIRDPLSSVRDHSIPVIAMTANVMSADIEKCHLSGMNGHVAKPVDADKLLKILKKCLSQANEQALKQQQKGTEKNIHKNKRTTHTDDELRKTPVLDYDALSKRMMEDEELIRTVADAFLIDIEQQVEQFKTLVTEKKMAQIVMQSHKIKGVTANIGGMMMSAIAHEMESFAKKDDIESIQMRTVEFENSYLKLKSALEKKIK